MTIRLLCCYMFHLGNYKEVSESYKRLKLDGEDMEIGSDDIQLRKPYDISTGGKSWYPMYYLGDFDYQIYGVDVDGNKTPIQFPDIK